MTVPTSIYSNINIFNWNERNTNNISSLGRRSNSNKKNTDVCHETVIIFQCVQIRKLGLVKKIMAT